MFGTAKSETKTREYPIQEKDCGYGFSPYDKFVMNCQNVKSITEFSDYYSGTNVTDNTSFTGFQKDFHFGIGGHIKIGWEKPIDEAE